MPIRFTVAAAILMGLVVAVPAATTITIIQRGLALDRASVSLTKGDRLSFSNDDDVIHNIHIFGPGAEDSADLGLQNGAYRVRCNIHPSVKMAVTVN
jgi:plastocyanin